MRLRVVHWDVSGKSLPMLESSGLRFDVGGFTRMFCRDGGDTPEAPAEEASEEDSDPIVIECDAPRPATILRVAGELEGRGARYSSSSKR